MKLLYAIPLLLVFLAACTTTIPAMEEKDSMEQHNDNSMMEGDDKEMGDVMENDDNMMEGTNTPPPPPPAQAAELSPWLATELKDVNTGETFTINDFKGEKVLIENFAVWCPKCLSQQKIIQDIRAAGDDGVVHVNINTDANEDENKVLEHTQKHGFDWQYAVAPEDFTQALISDFGSGVVSAPSVPMILVCEDQSTRFLGRGIKNADRLAEELAQGCASA